MASFTLRQGILILSFIIACVYAEKNAASIASMSVPEIEKKLQVNIPHIVA